MTFEPAKLERLGASLDAEVKSAGILRERLDALASKGEEGDAGKGAEAEGVKRAREVLAAYTVWLANPSGEFRPGEGMEAMEDMPAEDREVQDVIGETLARQRYISNQLTLLSLKSKRKPKDKSHIEKLQSYNEVKDAAQELMGLVAENRGVAVGALYEENEFGVSAAD